MAMSEVFNLDFKFGGNAEFLVKLEALLQRIDSRFDTFEGDVKDSTKATEDMADAVDDLNDSFKDGIGTMTSFGEKLKDIAKYYLSFQAIRSGAERVWAFGTQSMEAFSTQERAENQLKGVMKNRGTLDQFQLIKDYAAQIQGRSIYGDEAMIKGAGELATYVQGTKSLVSMMDLLTDYAAGMTGGGEVSPEQMESLATGLGMAYDGNYMAMRRKGFDTSKLEALDALAENGGVWNAKMEKKYGSDWSDEDKKNFKELVKDVRELGGVTEEMRVDALRESLSDWQGLSEEVNKLDSSVLIKFNNKLSDMREEIGKRLYPVFNKMLGMIEDNMPKIEQFYNSVAQAFESIATAIMENIGTLAKGVELLAEGISFLAKWYKPLTMAIVAMKLVPPAMKAIALASNTLATSGLGGLTKSLIGLANPAALAGTAVLGLAAVMWNIWDKSIQEQHKRTRDISSGIVDEKVKKYGELRKRYDSATNEYEKRGLFAEMESARKEAEKQVGIYAEANEGYAKAEWKEFFPNDVYMTGYNGQSKGKVKFGYGNEFKNPFDSSMMDEFKKLMEDGKTKIYAPVTNNNITQKVNVAAEVEKIGMLLNLSVRAAIEQAMRKDKNQMAVGNI